jgi:hypothetical protein
VLSGERPKKGEAFLFGTAGARAWTVKRLKTERLLRPDSIAATSAGEIAVLDNYRDQIYFYTHEGDRTRTVDLRESLQQRPRRPYGLQAGPDGTLLVRDQDLTNTWCVIDLKGNEIDRFSPHGPFDSKSPARLGRGLDVWASNGMRLFRIGQNGDIRESIGNDPRGRELKWPGAVYIDFLGRICLQDLVTGAVHTFDHTGKPLQVCRPHSPTSGISRLSKLAVAPDGSIYASCVRRRADHMAFSPAGDWLGFEHFGSRSVLFDPRSDRRWLLNGTLQLVDVGGRKVHEISRLPGGRLLEGVPAVAPDGRLAVVNEHSVALYSSDGELEDTFAVALTVVPKLLSYGAAGWLVVSEEEEANLIRVKDRAVWSFEVEDAPSDPSFAYGFSPDGSELWAVERSGCRLHRYSLDD